MAAVPHLLDSNAFLRLAKRDDPEHALVKTAIERFRNIHLTQIAARIGETGKW
jgi:predicted nucleic acid-binding protein